MVEHLLSSNIYLFIYLLACQRPGGLVSGTQDFFSSLASRNQQPPQKVCGDWAIDFFLNLWHLRTFLLFTIVLDCAFPFWETFPPGYWKKKITMFQLFDTLYFQKYLGFSSIHNTDFGTFMMIYFSVGILFIYCTGDLWILLVCNNTVERGYIFKNSENI